MFEILMNFVVKEIILHKSTLETVRYYFQYVIFWRKKGIIAHSVQHCFNGVLQKMEEI